MATLLTMDVYVYAEPIRVTVETEDGVVSYAEIEHPAGSGMPPERCWVSNADRTVRWEYGVDGDWRRADVSQVSHDKDVRDAMGRAARAGLVAAGRA